MHTTSFSLRAGLVRVRSRLLVLVLTCAASLGGGAAAAAQTRATTGDLGGLVVDQSGAALGDAAVTATNVETNLARRAVTAAGGRFAIPALPPGTYTVGAEKTGFASQAPERVTIALGTFTDVAIVLRVAGVQENVTVTGDTAAIDTQKTAIATVVSERQIDNLPINGRNFISFAVITAGVSTDRTPQQGASATSGLTFAGQRARSNNITVDGVDNNDPYVGSVRATFSQEAVREFQVLTNSFSAEFGKASGGVVNIVTKSGTNTPRGNAFFFFRDRALNAKGRFEKVDPAGTRVDLPKAPYTQNQFGGTVGGPLRRDRSFFFLSFERLDIGASNLVTIDDRTVVPHPFAPVSLGTPAAILRRAGFPVETGNVPYAVESSQFLAKLDQHVRPNHMLTARFNYADTRNENIEPFGGLVARSRAAALDATDSMFAASYTSVLSARLVNEARVQLASRAQSVLALDPGCAGACDSNSEGGPTLEVPGFASVGRHRFTPQNRDNLRYQVIDTVSLYVGQHQLKAGFDYSFIDDREKNDVLPLHFGGRYIFAALPAIPGVLPAPVSPIQAVALGLPGAYVQGYGNASAQYDTADISLFLQDDWRITPRLTAKAGLRYQNQFWPDVTYNVPGYPGSFGFPKDGNNIAPRLALAWDPAGDRKTSVHGAYGLFYDNHIIGLVGITDLINGENHVRTLVLPFPNSVGAWNAPGHRLPAGAVPSFPSLEISIDPGLETPYAHHASFGVDRDLSAGVSASASVVYARGLNQLGTIDYNPVVPALGASRRPLDFGGIPGTSASVLQYTSFGETWYKGLTLAVQKRFSGRSQFLASYTLSEAEDNSTDFQSAFLPQENGRGRDAANLKGLPVGFDPDSERGPSLQDQRHRLVVSGMYLLPGNVMISSIVTVASGRPYNILAGADLNGDGNGGAFPPDRARGERASQATSVGRDAGTLPSHATVDARVSRRFPLGGRASVEGIFEVFNLFNRVNYTDINNIFGAGAYPAAPLPTFGQFTQAAAPLQAQIGIKVHF